MIIEKLQVKFLKRRYGYAAVPAIMVNSLILWAVCYKIYKFGARGLEDFNFSFFCIFLFFNIIPFIILYDIWIYRVGWSDDAIYARPLNKFGHLRQMRMQDIDVVDLKDRSDLVKSANAKLSPSVIVLYRKGWDGDEIFALDPRRTNLSQFRDLIRLIYNRRPEAFTPDALRYLASGDIASGDNQFR